MDAAADSPYRFTLPAPRWRPAGRGSSGPLLWVNLLSLDAVFSPASLWSETESGRVSGRVSQKNMRLEGKRMASGDTGNVVPHLCHSPG